MMPRRRTHYDVVYSILAAHPQGVMQHLIAALDLPLAWSITTICYTMKNLGPLKASKARSARPRTD